MPFKIAGVDENGNFTPRVETALLTKIKNEVSVDGKATKEALDLIYAPISGGDKYASLGTDGKVLASQLPAQQASTPTLRTAYVNFPPVWEKVTTTAGSAATRGIYFVCTNSGTVKKLRAKVNTTAGQVYTLGIYELSPTNRTTVSAVVGTVNFTETVTTTGKIIEVDANLPIVAGKYYLISVSNASLVVYYTNSGGYFGSAVSQTIYEGAVDPQRSAGVTPVNGTSMTVGSDYVCVGMSVDY